MSRVTASKETAVRDPIDAFIEEQRLHGKSERTRTMYERILTDFAEETLGETRPGSRLESIDRTSCMEWVHSLRASHRPSTIATYASTVNRFYRYMIEIDRFDTNPMALVVDQMDETVDTDPVRRDISIEEMRTFVATTEHPLDRAIVLMLVKTGIRVGELCNLDLRDLSLSSDELDGLDWRPRGQLGSRRNSMFVDTEPTRGASYNGERRAASNKRRRATIIPIDEELRTVLVHWLAIRPDPRSPAQPLFMDTGNAWGARLTTDQARYRIRTLATSIGWYEQGGDSSENVTPHYFRHFFTTHMRDRIGDRGIVKYLRGDVADDVIDTYTHNWGDRVRDRYETHIYKLL